MLICGFMRIFPEVSSGINIVWEDYRVFTVMSYICKQILNLQSEMQENWKTVILRKQSETNYKSVEQLMIKLQLFFFFGKGKMNEVLMNAFFWSASATNVCRACSMCLHAHTLCSYQGHAAVPFWVSTAWYGRNPLVIGSAPNNSIGCCWQRR